jgi:drug/metabolite transporter (DMT)-like permease
VPVSRLAFIGVAAPLIALTLGVLVRHERLTSTSAVGAVIVLLGLSLGLEIGRTRKAGGSGRS